MGANFRANVNRYQHAPRGKVHLHIGDSRHALCGRASKSMHFLPGPINRLCTECDAISRDVLRRLERMIDG